MNTELFPLVNENGDVTGSASRQECHSGSFLLHPVVHLHVFNSKGELYLQLRAINKDTQPNKWDTSVGGHVDYGEEITDALIREAFEELSLKEFTPIFIQKYKFTSNIEAELVNCYFTVFDGEIKPCPIETQGGRFWSIAEIKDSIGKDILTPNFEKEFKQIKLAEISENITHSR